jgi:enoyl-CoA hydratase/carnithine racemase
VSDTNASIGKVRVEADGHVLKIIIDNSTKRNAITPLMMEQFHDAITLLDGTDDYWVGVVCAEGKDFTAGLVLPEFFDKNAQRMGSWVPKQGKIDALGLESRCRKPIVTAVQGLVYAIGLEIMLTGDIVIAADDCRFSQIEPARGLATLAGGYFRHLSRAGWGDAMYHLLLCDTFTSERAHKIGFVQEIVPAGTQIERAMEIAQLIAKNAPISIQATKEAAHRYIEANEKAAIAFLPEMEDRVLKSEDVREGILSFIERRAASFRGR